jgi:hypothetical protein
MIKGLKVFPSLSWDTKNNTINQEENRLMKILMASFSLSTTMAETHFKELAAKSVKNVTGDKGKVRWEGEDKWGNLKFKYFIFKTSPRIEIMSVVISHKQLRVIRQTFFALLLMKRVNISWQRAQKKNELILFYFEGEKSQANSF